MTDKSSVRRRWPWLHVPCCCCCCSCCCRRHVCCLLLLTTFFFFSENNEKPKNVTDTNRVRARSCWFRTTIRIRPASCIANMTTAGTEVAPLYHTHIIIRPVSGFFTHDVTWTVSQIAVNYALGLKSTGRYLVLKSTAAVLLYFQTGEGPNIRARRTCPQRRMPHLIREV